MPDTAYTADEMMTVAAARMLRNGAVCFVGIGLPSAAANLARLTHAPGVVLIYESGTIGSKPDVLPLSIGDGELAETADAVVSTVEIFSYWLQGGRVDVGFLGAAQIDRFANPRQKGCAHEKHWSQGRIHSGINKGRVDVAKRLLGWGNRTLGIEEIR